MRAWQHFGNVQTVRCVLCVRVWDAWDDRDAGGRICTIPTGLRALWGNFPVVVRVHSGALFIGTNAAIYDALQRSVRARMPQPERLRQAAIVGGASRRALTGGSASGATARNSTVLLYWHGMTHRVGAKGQIVIPKDLRERAGLVPGADVEF